MDAWRRFEDDLSQQLRSLPDETRLHLTGPSRPGRKPLLGWPGRQQQVPFRAEFYRRGDLLFADLVGGPQMGAAFPWTDAEHAALQDLGWEPPFPPPPLKGPFLRVYERRFEGFLEPAGLPEPVAREIATVLTRTLAEVVAATPQQVIVEPSA